MAEICSATNLLLRGACDRFLVVGGGAVRAFDGDLADCDERLPERFRVHAWWHVQAQKAALFHGHLDHLKRKLSDILRAAFVHSEAGQQPAALVGGRRRFRRRDCPEKLVSPGRRLAVDPVRRLTHRVISDDFRTLQQGGQTIERTIRKISPF